MTWFDKLRARWGKRKPEPPVIKTVVDGQEYAVTEWARLQAAINLRIDPVKREAVEKMIGTAEAKRRYPEAWGE